MCTFPHRFSAPHHHSYSALNLIIIDSDLKLVGGCNLTTSEDAEEPGIRLKLLSNSSVYTSTQCGVIEPGSVDANSTNVLIMLEPTNGVQTAVRIDTIVVQPC